MLEQIQRTEPGASVNFGAGTVTFFSGNERRTIDVASLVAASAGGATAVTGGYVTMTREP